MTEGGAYRYLQVGVDLGSFPERVAEVFPEFGLGESSKPFGNIRWNAPGGPTELVFETESLFTWELAGQLPDPEGEVDPSLPDQELTMARDTGHELNLGIGLAEW